MKKTIVVVFSVIAFALVSFFLVRILTKKDDTSEMVRPKMVRPNKKTQTEDIDSSELYANTEFENISLIQLNMDETLIATLSIDLDNDGYEDQVIGVKKATNPNIVVVFGVYDADKAEYNRKLEIQTQISQGRTFNLLSMDLIGNHTNSSIITGFDANNNSIMIAYAPKFSGMKFNLVRIVNLQTDGNILIQQTTRSDNYSIYNMNEDSWSILTSSTEETPDGKNFSQVETIYDWDEKSFSYVEKSSAKISNKRLAAKELARIQDGTISTFHAFLDGLWYKTADDSKSEHYLFFNPNDKEIIFLSNNTQEVYDWLSSTLRRTGIFISSSNKSISNLVRYFNIDLISTDEIRVRIRDDVRMIIGTEANWDGVYKKKKTKYITQEYAKIDDKISAILEKDSGKWENSNACVVFRENSFTFTENTQEYAGVYTITNIHNTDLIQFRSRDKNCKLNGFFIYQQNDNHLDLIPVVVTTDSCVIEGGSVPIRLEKFQTN